MPKDVIKIDDHIFKRKLNNLLKHIQRPIVRELPTYTEWFIQSAIKLTNPKRGAKKKRTVIELKTNRFTRRGKEKKRYKVPYRTNKSKGAKYFDKKSEANKFAKIIYRFIGKYGWLASGENVLKKKVNARLPKVNQKVTALKQQIGKGKRKYKTLKPFVLIINAVDKISKYALSTSFIALKKTERRIKRSNNKRKIKKNYSKLWR